MNRLLSIAAVASFAALAPAQSLFIQSMSTVRRPEERELKDTEVAQASLFFVNPPEPRDFMAHDLITIIIDETSKQTSSQTLDTKKESKDGLTLKSIVDPWELLELRLRQGELSNESLLGTDFKRDFKGEGDYERSDKFDAKITAEIVEVKPNGTLVLQATKTISKDEEVQTLVLAGVARREDITDRNTILSSQLANLSLTLENEGAVRDAAKKGLFTRILDAVFNF